MGAGGEASLSHHKREVVTASRRALPPCGAPVAVEVPAGVADGAMRLLRASAPGDLRVVDRGDEPPIRVLECGVYGESAPVEPDAPAPPRPALVERGGRWFCSWRWDSDVLNERLFRGAGAPEAIARRFGSGGKGADAIFRRVLGYGTGSRANVMRAEAEALADGLEAALKAAALQVYGEQGNADAAAASHVYSVYANVLLPGQIINMHIDVPEFRGLDRSKCPNWLLAVAHCSGLFEDARVRNVTCVFYPSTAAGGALAVYLPLRDGTQSGRVYPAARGHAVAMDADTCNHHSEQAKRVGACGPDDVHATPALPERCALVCRTPLVEGGAARWALVDLDRGERTVEEFDEGDLRFSISCKIHVFSSQQERDAYYAGKGAVGSLTAADLLRGLCEDLKSRGVELPPAGPGGEVPLFDLAPLLVDEYIMKTSPTAGEIASAWDAHYATAC